ncbi:MAG TPA: hypothetical protein VD772_00790, partial [Anseongella sp.]|nr:hypothetical protein [Anseongella sp.]
PTVLEAARVLSGTLLAQKDLSEKERIQRAFRRIICRTPSEREFQLLEAYYQQELQRYQKAPEKARAFLQVGEYPAREGLDPATHAALMAVVHGMYNLEEAITKS